jgi:hypothetical protein
MLMRRGCAYLSMSGPAVMGRTLTQHIDAARCVEKYTL